MDEGWTRFLLERFSFPYESMKPEAFTGDLRARFDVIILPDDSAAMITGSEEVEDSYWANQVFPPEYMGGIDAAGQEALRDFVERGGTLVTLGRATDFAIEQFDLDVKNVLDGLSRKEFFCPGSTLRVTIDNTSPAAYGMPDEGLVLFWGSPAFQIEPSRHNDRYEVPVRYADRDLMQSGWLIGEEHLAEKGAMVTARYGDGRVLLIGFPAQHRAQTHGTFKLLFNALLK